MAAQQELQYIHKLEQYEALHFLPDPTESKLYRG